MIHSLSKTVIIVSFFKKFVKVVNFVFPQLLIIKNVPCRKKKHFNTAFYIYFQTTIIGLNQLKIFPLYFEKSWLNITLLQSVLELKRSLTERTLFIFLLYYLWAEKPTDPAMKMMSAKFCCCPSLVRSAWKTLSKMTASGNLGRGGQNGS